MVATAAPYWLLAMVQVRALVRVIRCRTGPEVTLGCVMRVDRVAKVTVVPVVFIHGRLAVRLKGAARVGFGAMRVSVASCVA